MSEWSNAMVGDGGPASLGPISQAIRERAERDRRERGMPSGNCGYCGRTSERLWTDKGTGDAYCDACEGILNRMLLAQSKGALVELIQEMNEHAE